jgi:hypothetical protein
VKKKSDNLLSTPKGFPTVGLLALAASLVGCGSTHHGHSPSSGGDSVSGDSGNGGDSGSGGGVVAAATGGAGGDGGSGGSDGPGGTEGETDCGAVAPSGRQIVASPAPIVLEGLTGDGNYVLYADTNEQLYYAAPIAGGPPVVLGKTEDTLITPKKKGALLSPYGGVTGALSAWTEAGGVHPIATDAYSFDAEMSDDGSLVAYFTRAADAGTLTVSSTDGTKRKILVSSPCGGWMEFAQSNLVAEYCIRSDGEFSESAFATFTGPTFTPTVIPAASPLLGQSTLFHSIDPAGQYVVGRSPAALSLYPIVGGPPIEVDTEGMLSEARFLESGDLLYTTTNGDMVRYALATRTKTSLSSGSGGQGFDILAGNSPDGKWILASMNTNQVTGIGQLYLASLAGPAPATSLQANVAPFGFTTDSLFALFLTIETPQAPSPYILHAAPVSGGTPVRVESTAGSTLLLAGSKIVTNTNLEHYDFKTAIGRADIEVINLERPTEKMILVTQAGLKPQVTPSKDIVYAWSCKAGPNAGIWVTPSP